MERDKAQKEDGALSITPPADSTRVDVCVVVPVYNEEACVASVVASWIDALQALDMRFRIIVLDDGSSDGTPRALERIAADPRVSVVRHANRGHGPTILRGYHLAIDQADWVFQCDSDGEIPASAFADLWRRREGCDAVFGVRTGRHSGPGRRLLSLGARVLSSWRFKQGVQDANVPFRLMRADWLRCALRCAPGACFAPNVILSGALAGMGARIANVPVPYSPRRTGRSSLTSWRLWRVAFTCLRQTLAAPRPPAPPEPRPHAH